MDPNKTVLAPEAKLATPLDVVDQLEIQLRNKHIVDAAQLLDAKPVKAPTLTPLDRARLMSDAIYAKTGFRPRYVLIDGVKVDTESQAAIPLASLFPALRTRNGKR